MTTDYEEGSTLTIILVRSIASGPEISLLVVVIILKESYPKRKETFGEILSLFAN